MNEIDTEHMTEDELFEQWMHDKTDALYCAMIDRFSYLIYTFLKRETYRSANDKDLFHEGILGLIMAIQKCDADKTVSQFKVYAKLWIRFYVWQYLNNTKSVVHISKKERAERKMNQTQHEDVCFDESFAQSWENEPMHAFDMQHLDDLNDQLHCIQEMLSTLKPKEQYVIEKRYLETEMAHTFVELSHDLNMTPQGVKKIESTAIKKMRTFMDQHHFNKEDFL
ncbi:MAG: RNA polymerase sigma factor RpoS [Holosporales bacterium]